MKTEVYSWRLSATRKADLESEARREGTSVSNLLEQITADWLAQRRNGNGRSDEVEQAAIRKQAAAAIGSIRGGDPTRSTRASELVREIIARKHAKESRAFLRTARRAN
jgi:hypothetical protein